MIEWNEYELIEFFGILPHEDEDKTYLGFDVKKGDLRIKVTFFYYGSAIYIDIFQEGIERSIFHTQIDNPLSAHYVNQKNGYECLDISFANENSNTGEIVIRLEVNPHIRVEL